MASTTYKRPFPGCLVAADRSRAILGLLVVTVSLTLLVGETREGIRLGRFGCVHVRAADCDYGIRTSGFLGT